MDVMISPMKKIFLFLILSLSSVSAWAEFSLDDLSLKKITDMKGWTPRYAYVSDDNLIGHTHYAGVSFFKREGAVHEGPTLRFGLGTRGEKINLAFTSGFSFLGVDIGLSYLFPDKEQRANFRDAVEGLGLELGLRMWVVQVIAIHTDQTSYISLAYGF
jgi:hypothetical protein